MKRNKKGFTIVELVIVIGVIGILSAILIPTFVGLTDKAQKAAKKEGLANAYSSYVSDLPYGEIPLSQEEVIFVEAKETDDNDKVIGYVFDAANGGWQTEAAEYSVVDDSESVAIKAGEEYWLYERA